MNDVWKYMDSGEVKHLFYTSSRTSAICGVTNVWFSPIGWKEDSEGLAQRRSCKKCLKISK